MTALIQASTSARTIILGEMSAIEYALKAHQWHHEGAGELVFRARGMLIPKAFAAANIAITTGLPLRRGQVYWGKEAGEKGEPATFAEIHLIEDKVEEAQAIQANLIKVGSKRAANYVLAVQMRLAQGQTVITLRARGKAIATAVDAACACLELKELGLRRDSFRWGQEIGEQGPQSWTEIVLAKI